MRSRRRERKTRMTNIAPGMAAGMDLPLSGCRQCRGCRRLLPAGNIGDCVFSKKLADVLMYRVEGLGLGFLIFPPWSNAFRKDFVES